MRSPYLSLLLCSVAAAAPPRTRYPPSRLLSPMTPAVVENLRRIAARCPRQDKVFAKVGCSITASPRFLSCLAGDDVDLGPFRQLRPALLHFGAGDAAGGDPFSRVSKAAWPGWSVANVLAGGTRSALEAELRAVDPRFALVMYGTNDIERGDLPGFTRQMWRLLERLTEGGVIPLVSTIPPRADKARARAEVPRYNAVIRSLAEGLRVPLIDLNRALRFLPREGLGPDGVHPSAFRRAGRVSPCDFTGPALRYGYNTRNLLSLAALEAARRVVVAGEPAPEPGPLGERARGDLQRPVPMGALPFGDLATVRAGPDGRGRRVYRLELSRPTLLETFVVDRPKARARLSLLADLEGGPKWLVRDRTRIEASLGPGAWLVVVDVEPQGGQEPGRYLVVARALGRGRDAPE